MVLRTFGNFTRRCVGLSMATSLVLGVAPMFYQATHHLPVANAAGAESRTESGKLELIQDGTGFEEGAQRTYIQTSNGFEIGDDSPNDGVVTVGDLSIYKFTLDFKAGPARTVPVTLNNASNLVKFTFSDTSAWCKNGAIVKASYDSSAGVCNFTIPAGAVETVSRTLGVIGRVDVTDVYKKDNYIPRTVTPPVTLSGRPVPADSLTVVGVPWLDLQAGATSVNVTDDLQDITGDLPFRFTISAVPDGYSSTQGLIAADNPIPYTSVFMSVDQFPAGTVFTYQGSTLTPKDGVIELRGTFSSNPEPVRFTIPRSALDGALDEEGSQLQYVYHVYAPENWTLSGARNLGTGAEDGTGQPSDFKTAVSGSFPNGNYGSVTLRQYTAPPPPPEREVVSWVKGELILPNRSHTIWDEGSKSFQGGSGFVGCNAVSYSWSSYGSCRVPPGVSEGYEVKARFATGVTQTTVVDGAAVSLTLNTDNVNLKSLDSVSFEDSYSNLDNTGGTPVSDYEVTYVTSEGSFSSFPEGQHVKQVIISGLPLDAEQGKYIAEITADIPTSANNTLLPVSGRSVVTRSGNEGASAEVSVSSRYLEPTEPSSRTNIVFRNPSDNVISSLIYPGDSVKVDSSYHIDVPYSSGWTATAKVTYPEGFQIPSFISGWTETSREGNVVTYTSHKNSSSDPAQISFVSPVSLTASGEQMVKVEYSAQLDNNGANPPAQTASGGVSISEEEYKAAHLVLDEPSSRLPWNPDGDVHWRFTAVTQRQNASGDTVVFLDLPTYDGRLAGPIEIDPQYSTTVKVYYASYRYASFSLGRTPSSDWETEDRVTSWGDIRRIAIVSSFAGDSSRKIAAASGRFSLKQPQYLGSKEEEISPTLQRITDNDGSTSNLPGRAPATLYGNVLTANLFFDQNKNGIYNYGTDVATGVSSLPLERLDEGLSLRSGDVHLGDRVTGTRILPPGSTYKISVPTHPNTTSDQQGIQEFVDDYYTNSQLPTEVTVGPKQAPYETTVVMDQDRTVNFGFYVPSRGSQLSTEMVDQSCDEYTCTQTFETSLVNKGFDTLPAGTDVLSRLTDNQELVQVVSGNTASSPYAASQVTFEGYELTAGGGNRSNVVVVDDSGALWWYRRYSSTDSYGWDSSYPDEAWTRLVKYSETEIGPERDGDSAFATGFTSPKGDVSMLIDAEGYQWTVSFVDPNTPYSNNGSAHLTRSAEPLKVVPTEFYESDDPRYLGYSSSDERLRVLIKGQDGKWYTDLNGDPITLPVSDENIKEIYREGLITILDKDGNRWVSATTNPPTWRKLPDLDTVDLSPKVTRWVNKDIGLYLTSDTDAVGPAGFLQENYYLYGDGEYPTEKKDGYMSVCGLTLIFTDGEPTFKTSCSNFPVYDVMTAKNLRGGYNLVSYIYPYNWYSGGYQDPYYSYEGPDPKVLAATHNPYATLLKEYPSIQKHPHGFSLFTVSPPADSHSSTYSSSGSVYLKIPDKGWNTFKLNFGLEGDNLFNVIEEAFPAPANWSSTGGEVSDEDLRNHLPVYKTFEEIDSLTLPVVAGGITNDDGNLIQPTLVSQEGGVNTYSVSLPFDLQKDQTFTVRYTTRTPKPQPGAEGEKVGYQSWYAGPTGFQDTPVARRVSRSVPDVPEFNFVSDGGHIAGSETCNTGRDGEGFNSLTPGTEGEDACDAVGLTIAALPADTPARPDYTVTLNTWFDANANQVDDDMGAVPDVDPKTLTAVVLNDQGWVVERSPLNEDWTVNLTLHETGSYTVALDTGTQLEVQSFPAPAEGSGKRGSDVDENGSLSVNVQEGTSLYKFDVSVKKRDNAPQLPHTGSYSMLMSLLVGLVVFTGSLLLTRRLSKKGCNV